MKKILLFCLVLGLGAGFATLARAAAVISQVQITGGSGKASEDFVELFNPAETPFNLNGYRLVKRTATGTEDTLIKSWTTDTFIPARSFYLWANSGFTAIAVTPDETTSASLADNNGIALRLGANNSGTIVDSLAWGTADNSFVNVSSANPEANQSLVRQDLYAASSSFAIAASYPRNTTITDTSATTTPEQPDPPATTTPEQLPAENQNPPPQNSGGSAPEVLLKSAAVKISEILPNPTGEDSGSEQVELINTGSKAVNIEGWFLGDGTDVAVKSNAYKISAYVLGPGAVQTILLPKGSFTLNNSGDTVRLYYADKIQADAVTYTGGREGLSYQLVSGQWLWQAPSLGSANVAVVVPNTTQVTIQPVTITVSELMPNPIGADEGKEWIELHNTGILPVSLKGYMIGNGGTDPGTAPYLITDDLMVEAGGYAVLTLAEDSMSLTNTADAISLFSPSRQFIERVSYEKAEEGKSLSKNKNGSWEFGLPSPGKENVIDLPLYTVVISEVLPNPGADQDEFIELQNVGAEAVLLKDFTVSVGIRRMQIVEDITLEPNAYVVFYEDQLPIALRNSGQTVLLFDGFGRKTAEVVYPKAAAGFSYARTAAGEYAWTGEPTPGQANAYVLGAELWRGGEAESAPASPAKTAASRQLTLSQLNAALAEQNRELEAKLVALETKLDAALQQQMVMPSEPKETADGEAAVLETEQAIGRTPYVYLFGTAAVFLLALILFRAFLKSSRNRSTGDFPKDL